jgi:hypothetical protein
MTVRIVESGRRDQKGPLVECRGSDSMVEVSPASIDDALGGPIGAVAGSSQCEQRAHR